MRKKQRKISRGLNLVREAKVNAISALLNDRVIYTTWICPGSTVQYESDRMPRTGISVANRHRQSTDWIVTDAFIGIHSARVRASWIFNVRCAGRYNYSRIHETDDRLSVGNEQRGRNK